MRSGVEVGGMWIRDREELEENVKFFKDMMREHFVV